MTTAIAAEEPRRPEAGGHPYHVAITPLEGHGRQGGTVGVFAHVMPTVAGGDQLSGQWLEIHKYPDTVIMQALAPVLAQAVAAVLPAFRDSEAAGARAVLATRERAHTLLDELLAETASAAKRVLGFEANALGLDALLAQLSGQRTDE